jgi:hypothetical protein
MSSLLARLDTALKPWIWVLFPAIILHEYTHALAARLAGAETDVEWFEETPVAVMQWPERPPLEIEVLVHLAPTYVGLPVIGATLAFDLLAGLAWPLAAYGALNAVGYVVPSGTDTAPLRRYLTA